MTELIDVATNKKFDIKNDTFRITLQQSSVSNPTDIIANNTSSFLLDDTQNNAELLEHIDIVASNSDKKRKNTDVILIVDGVQIIQNGNLQILSYRKNEGYRVTVFDRAFNFFSSIRNKKLSDLQALNVNINYRINNISPFFNNEYTNIFCFADVGQCTQVTQIFDESNNTESTSVSTLSNVYDNLQPSYFGRFLFEKIIEEENYTLLPNSIKSTDEEIFNNFLVYNNKSNSVEQLSIEDNFSGKYNLKAQLLTSTVSIPIEQGQVINVPFNNVVAGNSNNPFVNNVYTLQEDMFLNGNARVNVSKATGNAIVAFELRVQVGATVYISEILRVNTNSTPQTFDLDFNNHFSNTTNLNISAISEASNEYLQTNLLIPDINFRNILPRNTTIQLQVRIIQLTSPTNIIFHQVANNSTHEINYFNSYSSPISFNQTYNLANNAPDLTQRDFLADCLTLLRKNIRVLNNTVKLYDYTDVLNAPAYDFTHKIDVSSLYELDFQTNAAKNNIIKYNSVQNIADNYLPNFITVDKAANGVELVLRNQLLQNNEDKINIEVDFDNVEEERTLYTLQSPQSPYIIGQKIFALCNLQTVAEPFPKPQNNIKPIYFLRNEGTQIIFAKFVTKQVKRIATRNVSIETESIVQNTRRTKPLLLNSDISPRYSTYKNILELNTKLEVNAALSLSEIAALDLSRPVYLNQFSSLFLIDRVEYNTRSTIAKLILAKL